jgi:hypothetical protein
LLLVAVAVPARAAAEALTVVVRVATPDDEALLARVRGQTSDLDVALVTEAGALEPEAADRRRAAPALARRAGARVVVWFEPRKRGFRVHVADVGEGRLLSRDVDGDRRGDGRSALYEAVAQVVRSALQSIIEGQPLEDTVALDPEPVPDPDTRPDPVPSPPRPRRPWYDARLAVGGGLAWDGTGDPDVASPTPHIVSRLDVPIGPVRATLALDHFARYARLEDPAATLKVGRVLFVAGVSVPLWSPRPFTLAAGARGGIALFSRHTLLAAPPAMATPPATTTAFAGGPELDLTWAASRWLGVQLTLGIDVVAGAPTLGVDQTPAGGGFATIRDLWTFQPRLGISLVLRP